jgi:methionine-rich copper-binding protein CopC
MVKRWIAGVLGGLIAVFGVVAAAQSAHAASPLTASNPAPREELQDRPGWVTLAFSRTVKKSVVKVLVVGADGRNKVVGDLVYSGSSVMVQLDNALPMGTYTVKYQINRPDGQPEGGAYQFAYGKGKWTQVTESWSGTAEQPPEMANPDPMATTPVETPSVTPSPVVVEEGTPTPTVTPSETAIPTASATPEPVAPLDNGPLWIGLSAGVVVLLAAIGGWFVVRRRRRG